MAKLINISDESREKLDLLCDAETRTITGEIDFLLTKRMEELGLTLNSDKE